MGLFKQYLQKVYVILNDASGLLFIRSWNALNFKVLFGICCATD
jgi:hypothetical protein